MKHALLIAIDRYPNLVGRDLRGCVNDLHLMASLLVGRFAFPETTVRTLHNEEATRDGIRAALAHLASAVGHDDVTVLAYWGHASRMRDPRRPGRFVESIVPHDSGRENQPNRDILDEEIDRWVQQVNEKTPHVTLLFDCCHSGSVTRDRFGGAIREVPPDLRAPVEMFGGDPHPPLFAATRGVGEVQAGTGSGWFPGRRRAVVIAACRADEVANEHRVAGAGGALHHGALTYFLGRALDQIGPCATWRDVLEGVAPAVTSVYGRQHPQLEGRIDQLLFATGEVRPASYLKVVAVSKKAVELAGGAAHGVRLGSLWTVRPAGASHRESGEEVALVKVRTVRAATSDARVVNAAEAGSLTPGLRAFLSEDRLPESRLGVALAAEPALLPHLEAAVKDEPFQFLVEASQADVLIHGLPPREAVAAGDPCPGLGPLAGRTWAAVGRDGRLAVRARSGTIEEIRNLASDLAQLARYRNLLALENPDPESRLRDQVRLRVKLRDPAKRLFLEPVPEPGDAVPTIREGDRVEFEVKSLHHEPLWVTLIEFDCDGSIQLLMPRPGHATYREGGLELGPGQTVRVAADYYRQDPAYADAVLDGLPLELPKGFPWAAEPGEAPDRGLVHLKLLVTASSADFEFLEQGATRKGGARARDRSGGRPASPLERLMRLYASGSGSRSVPVGSHHSAPGMAWTTATVPLWVRQ